MNRIRTVTLVGVQRFPVEVEATADKGLSGSIVCPDLSEAASREVSLRVRSALAHVGIKLAGAFTVRLRAEHNAPLCNTDAFDLAIAAAVAGWGNAPIFDAAPILVGGLALSGDALPVRGALVHAAMACGLGVPCIVPSANSEEVSALDSGTTYPLLGLTDLHREFPPVAVARRGLDRSRRANTIDPPPLTLVPALADVRRALDAGQRRFLLVGKPESGKVLAARAVLGMLLPTTPDEAMSVALIQSAAGLLRGRPGYLRPFRAPHHTVSDVGLLGGGQTTPRPGEVTLAHHGVLLLDELGEFRKSTIHALAGVLRDGEHRWARWLATSEDFIARMPARPEVVIGTCEPRDERALRYAKELEMTTIEIGGEL
jgi:magnesium chelatase family protein